MAGRGRGAWNNAGLGGTKKYKDPTKPGPYYFTTTGYNIDVNDPNQYAVRGAVAAYQVALNRRLGTKLLVDGLYGKVTTEAVNRFQTENSIPDTTPWGGIGPDTSKALLYPDLKKVWKNRHAAHTPLNICSGTIRHESAWDAGAVGFVDPDDVGLAQINADAHPEWSVDKRLNPITSFQFVVDRYNADITFFKGNVNDAVAAYNLGRGGANRWISQGRPQWYTPQGSNVPRDVHKYINSILEG